MEVKAAMVEEQEPGSGMLTMGYSFSDLGAGATAPQGEGRNGRILMVSAAYISGSSRNHKVIQSIGELL